MRFLVPKRDAHCIPKDRQVNRFGIIQINQCAPLMHDALQSSPGSALSGPLLRLYEPSTFELLPGLSAFLKKRPRLPADADKLVNGRRNRMNRNLTGWVQIYLGSFLRTRPPSTRPMRFDIQRNKDGERIKRKNVERTSPNATRRAKPIAKMADTSSRQLQ